jgi:hypothetical protein
VPATGLAIDEENRLAYVSFYDSILQVHIDSEAVVLIAGPAIPGNRFQVISDLVLDAANQRLLVADAVLEAIVAVDLGSLQQTIVSQAVAAGEGPAFKNINSLALVTSSSSLYVSNQAAENIMRVDIATGDRQVVLQECLDASSMNVLGIRETLQQVHCNENGEELLILGDNLLSLDLETLDCDVEIPQLGNRGILRVQVTPQNQVLALTLGSLVQLDRNSAEMVIISR